MPPYAILSHTWETDEVTFQDMASPYLPPKSGYTKITETCRLALEMDIEHAWVDTCCIDKSSSAELTESINSMFQWYENAAVCYVYLADLHPGTEFRDGIDKCRWINRGWTLQELIAPRNVYFYDRAWTLRGVKGIFGRELSDATGIPVEILFMQHKISQYSVAQRISWASRRDTTRVEDAAYCLLGVLGVNIPLIYGEGSMAFRRLQEEVVKRNNDLTVFAWNPTQSEHISEHCSLLAASPAAFIHSRDIVPWKIYHYNPEFAITNKGLRVEDYLYGIPASTSDEQQTGSEYVLLVGVYSRNERVALGIHLRKVGPGLFLRQSRKLRALGSEERASLPIFSTSTFYTVTSTTPPDHSTLSMFRHYGTRVSIPGKIQSTIPETLWDNTDLFFYPDSPQHVRAIQFETTLNGQAVQCAILFGHKADSCTGYMFETAKYPAQTAYLFRRRDINHALRWQDLLVDYPELLGLKHRIELTVGTTIFTLTVVFLLQEVEVFGNMVTMHRLQLEVEEVGDECTSV